jgi:hypothetical protein
MYLTTGRALTEHIGHWPENGLHELLSQHPSLLPEHFLCDFFSFPEQQAMTLPSFLGKGKNAGCISNPNRYRHNIEAVTFIAEHKDKKIRA